MARFRFGSKYGAKKTQCAHGHTHDSKREASYCDVLHHKQSAGLICDLRLQEQFWFVIAGKQVKHDNGRRVGFKADFVYFDRQREQIIVADAKGYTVRDWPLRKAIFKALYPELVLEEV